MCFVPQYILRWLYKVTYNHPPKLNTMHTPLAPLPQPRLSVMLIVCNEAENIRDCLASVSWADEIVVLDSGSRDDTVAICLEYTSLVYVNSDWSGFGPQKNRALAYTTGDWVLSLDADERVPPALQTALRAAMQHPGYDAWQMSRRSWYCGRFMRHGGWWPDYVTRLFRRGSAQFSEDLVHERLLVTGALGTLHTPLLHYPFRRIEQVLHKINSYSSSSAQMLHQQGKPSGLLKAISHGLWAFIRCYIVRGGFLDGPQGFMLAVSNAEGTYYRYLKAWFLAQSKLPPD